MKKKRELHNLILTLVFILLIITIIGNIALTNRFKYVFGTTSLMPIVEEETLQPSIKTGKAIITLNITEKLEQPEEPVS